MSFREDECRIREAKSARCFAILRKIALNLIRQDSSSWNSIRAKRKKAGWSNDYVDNILFGKFSCVSPAYNFTRVLNILGVDVLRDYCVQRSGNTLKTVGYT